MRWQEPAILSLVSEAAVTKFAPGVGRRPKKRYRSVLLGGLILAALWFNLCKQLRENGWLTNNTIMGGSFLLSPSIFFGSAGKTGLRRPHPPKRSSPGFSLAFPRFFSFCRYDFLKSEHRSGGHSAGSTRPRLRR